MKRADVTPLRRPLRGNPMTLDAARRRLYAARDTYRRITRHPLTRDHKVATLARYARWQLACRLRAGKRVVPFVGETRLSVGRSMVGATGNIYVGLDEFRDMAYTLHLLRPADTFFDVGANVGTYTVLAAGVCGASVVAFEPVERAFNHLLDNVRLNGIEGRVRAERRAVGDRHGSVRVTDDQDTVNHVLADAESGGVSAELCPLDDFADLAPLLIKIDVEGYEDGVLAGADAVLRNTALRSVFVEANHSAARYGKSDRGVHETLLSHGFALCDYDPFARALTAVARGPGDEGNGLYVRDDDFVRERLRTAAPFVVLGRSI